MSDIDSSKLDDYLTVQIKELKDGGFMGSWFCKLCKTKDSSNNIGKDLEWEREMMLTSGRAHVWEYHPEVRQRAYSETN